jgi:hypothetical protein
MVATLRNARLAAMSLAVSLTLVTPGTARAQDGLSGGPPIRGRQQLEQRPARAGADLAFLALTLDGKVERVGRTTSLTMEVDTKKHVTTGKRDIRTREDVNRLEALPFAPQRAQDLQDAIRRLVIKSGKQVKLPADRVSIEGSVDGFGDRIQSLMVGGEEIPFDAAEARELATLLWALKEDKGRLETAEWGGSLKHVGDDLVLRVAKPGAFEDVTLAKMRKVQQFDGKKHVWVDEENPMVKVLRSMPDGADVRFEAVGRPDASTLEPHRINVLHDGVRAQVIQVDEKEGLYEIEVHTPPTFRAHHVVKGSAIGLPDLPKAEKGVVEALTTEKK